MARVLESRESRWHFRQDTRIVIDDKGINIGIHVHPSSISTSYRIQIVYEGSVHIWRRKMWIDEEGFRIRTSSDGVPRKEYTLEYELEILVCLHGIRTETHEYSFCIYECIDICHVILYDDIPLVSTCILHNDESLEGIDVLVDNERSIHDKSRETFIREATIPYIPMVLHDSIHYIPISYTSSEICDIRCKRIS